MNNKSQRIENLSRFNGGRSFLFALFFLSCGVFLANFVNAEENPEQPRVLEAWQLPDSQGEMVNFSPTQGETYRLVLFWATWCPYCKALMPHLEKFRKSNATPDFGFYALNVWEDGDPKAYVTDTDFNFRLVPEADAIAKLYGVKGTPGLFLVNERNEVIYERKSGTSPKQVITDLEFALGRRNLE